MTKPLATQVLDKITAAAVAAATVRQAARDAATAAVAQRERTETPAPAPAGEGA